MAARRWLCASCSALAVLATTHDATATGVCDEAGTTVLVTSALGVGVGAAGAVISSAIVSEADDTKDYDFAVGMGVGIGVTAGLTGLYAVVDYASGCGMAYDAGGYVVWSIPIVMILVGSLLPIAVWGASDDVEDTGAMQEALTAPAIQLPVMSFRF